MATLDELRAQAGIKQAERQAAIKQVLLDEELKLRILLNESNLELDTDVAVVVARTGRIIAVRKPTRAARKNYANAVNKGTLNSDVVENYLKGCLVYPTQRELQDILEESPGMLEAAVIKANELITSSEAEISANL